MGEKKLARLSRMYQKRKVLSMNYKNLEKFYTIDNKIVSVSLAASVPEKKGG